jgi:hypothetical protein
MIKETSSDSNTIEMEGEKLEEASLAMDIIASEIKSMEEPLNSRVKSAEVIGSPKCIIQSVVKNFLLPLLSPHSRQWK